MDGLDLARVLAAYHGSPPPVVPVTSFVPVTTGLFDDAGLAGFTTYAMRVTATTDWTNADLSIDLTNGTMNHVAPGGFFGSPNGPNGFGDTAGFPASNALGDITAGWNGTPGYAGTHVETPISFSSNWYSVEPDDIGTFDIAMITISDDAAGELLFRTMSGSAVHDGGFGGGPALFSISGGVISANYAPADFNTDGTVDGIDLGILLGNYGTAATPSTGELDGTPPVDSLDLGLLLAVFGTSGYPPLSAASAVPEPSALLLGVLASAGLILQRRDGRT